MSALGKRLGDLKKAGKLRAKLAKKGKLYVVEHGDTALDAKKRYQGWMNTPLSKRGSARAKSTAKALGKAGAPGLVVSSDLRRAVMTAKTIGEHVGAPVVKDKAMRPWHIGDYAGKSEKKTSKELQKMANTDQAPSGGEKFSKFATRFGKGLSRTMSKAHGRVVALVTHSKNIRLMRDMLKKSGGGVEKKLKGERPGKVWTYSGRRGLRPVGR